MKFPELDHADRLLKLNVPEGRIDVVIDTDTYNEIDDQFAVSYALKSPEKFNVQAINAAPFHNKRSRDAGDGMELSYDEIERLLKRIPEVKAPPVFKGSDRFLANNEGRAVESPAAQYLIESAMRREKENPLYVVAIGAPTNLASAIMLEPKIIEHMVVVWLGGHSIDWHDNLEFNLAQDPPSSRVLYDSGVPLMVVPCRPVASHMLTSSAELERDIKGANPLCDYLYESFVAYHENHYAWAKEIWDVASFALLKNPEWVPSYLIHTPELSDSLKWIPNRYRPFMRQAQMCQRNKIFQDLYGVLRS